MNLKPTKKPLYVAPVASTSFLQEAYWDRSRSAVRFVYEKEGVERHVAIAFSRPMVQRKTSESFCKVDQIDGCYDTLVEVESSPWVEEMFTPSAKKRSRVEQLQHYMIYLDSVGCFEFLAEGWYTTDEAHHAKQAQEAEG